MKKSHLTLKIFFLIILNDIVDTIAQVIMKKALVHAGLGPVTFSNLAESVSRGVSSVLLWLGVLLYVFNFFIWIVVLYKIDLSVAMPVGSTCYIFVPILAILFLHEEVGPIRWLGTLCIMLGIHFVVQSKKPAPEKTGDG